MPPSESVPRHRFVELNQLPVSLRLGSYTSEILSWGFLGTRWWRNYLHTHSFYEICYAFEGEGEFTMRGVPHRVCAGDVFVAKPSEPHEIVSSRESPLGIYFWSYTLVPVGGKSQTTATAETDALLRVFAASGRCVNSHAPAMLRTLELLTEEAVAQESGCQETIAHLTAKLLIDTARAVAEPAALPRASQAAGRDPSVMLAQRIEQYLRDNYDRPIRIRDVAAQVHLSERHTSRLFHQVTGCSIKERLTALRVEAASQLLLGGHVPIKGVAESTGYPDVQHFTTVFRRRTGLTPAAYRVHGGTTFANPAGPKHVQEGDVRFAK